MIHRRTVLVAALAALTGLTACAGPCPHMIKLTPMVGEHRFEGYRALGVKTEIGGKITTRFTPDGSILRLEYAQVRPEAEQGLGEIRWDPEAVEYVLTWKAEGRAGGPLRATGYVHVDGRLIFEGDVPGPGAAKRFIYTFTFPEPGKFILTIRHPGPKPDTVFESFRITADRI